MSYFKGIGRKSGSYTGRKLPLVGLLENKKHTIFNEYTVGSGVGASSVATRRLKKQRARIKKCTPPEPIYPELDENQYFEMSDDITGIEKQGIINYAPYGLTINLQTDVNSRDDFDVTVGLAKKHIEKISTSEVASLHFTTISVVNPMDNAVKFTGNNVNDLLSGENFKVTTSVNNREVVDDSSSQNDDSISQNIEHTFINTGQKDGERLLIEYIMTITVFESLQ